MDLAADLDRVARETPLDSLPELVGVLASAEARARLRLAQASTGPAPPAASILDAEAAATIAGSTPRWLNAKTRGLTFRCDLSRKRPRYSEDGLRAWLARRRA